MSSPATVNSGGIGPVITIKPRRGWIALNLRDLWDYRELLYFLTWRDVKVRYKQTVLGVAWAVIQPLATMLVFTIFFGRLANVPSDGVPYPVFTMCALLPWTLFSRAVSESSNSLVGNSNLISKVYFPRLVIPLAAMLGGLVDFAITLVLFIGMMAWYGIAPSIAVLTLPLLILLAIGTALGVSLWLSALNVEYRDVRYVLPFLVQMWMLASPIGYPASIVPSEWRFLYGLNPLTGVIEGFRWAMFRHTTFDVGLTATSAVLVVCALASGLIYFRRMERTFADVI